MLLPAAKFIHKHWAEITIFVLVSVLCLCNYTPNTFLSGWDNLHSEFNIWTNIQRSLFSTWQEYQGLGLLAGMAHAADIVRQLIILPFTLFLPTNLIRYLWHFSMLYLGTFGIYYLLLFITKNRLSGLVSAFFYLLNFASIQYFSAPFEPYSTFWGFLPWLILILFQTQNHPTRRNFFKFFLINLLATPSFYVQTIFVVYFVCVLIVVFLNFSIKNSAKILFLILFINSFWLLPNIYFTLTRVSITQNSMINQMATDQFIEQNTYRGNIQSFALLQGQYYDLKGNQSGANYLLPEWRQHFSQKPIQIIGYLIFAFCLAGIFIKNQYKKYFVTILIFGCIGFLCDTPPFNFINNLFRQIPLFNQIFRNSFTKLLVPTIVSLSVLLGLLVTKIRSFGFVIIALIIILSSPSFFGQYISPTMRVNIPPEYFQLFSYLQTQDISKRIVDLPQYNYWGWYNYRWGGYGSGFLWYGINQPITSRTFDVWDNNLEEFYWQLHHCLLSRDTDEFKQLLQKYRVSYVLFDGNSLFPDASNSGKVLIENQKLITESPFLSLEKKFGNLQLYSVVKIPDNITGFDSLPNVKIQPSFSYIDQAFTDYQSYQSNPLQQFDTVFQFNNLFSNHPNTPTKPQLINQIAPSHSWKKCLRDSNSSSISATNQEVIAFYNCSNSLDFTQGHILKIDSQNVSGRPLLVKVFSLLDHRLIIDTKINPSQNPSYFIIPPINSFDIGLGVNVSSLSFSNQPSTNIVNDMTIAEFDFNTIANTHSQFLPKPNQEIKIDSHRFNQTFYYAQITPQTKYLTLYQSFSPAWLAFYFDDHHPVFLTNHVLINNWANGWEINNINHNTIYIFFWPQLLEFLGFGLLIGALICVLHRH